MRPVRWLLSTVDTGVVPVGALCHKLPYNCPRSNQLTGEGMNQGKYGIRVTLPNGDSMGLPHLLGDNFEYFRWFESPQRRDREFEQMSHRYAYLRRGDNQTQVLTKVER